MSTPASEERWKSLLGNVPMPEGATNEMMWAARDAIEEMDEREEVVAMMKIHEESKKHYEELCDFWEGKKGDPQYTEKITIYRTALRLVEETLELYRERLL